MIKNEGSGRRAPRVLRLDGDQGLVPAGSPIFFVCIRLSIFTLTPPRGIR